jgi:hypothetical protein
LFIGESINEKKGLNPKKIDTKGFSMDSSSMIPAEMAAGSLKWLYLKLKKCCKGIFN